MWSCGAQCLVHIMLFIMNPLQKNPQITLLLVEMIYIITFFTNRYIIHDTYQHIVQKMNILCSIMK